MPFLDWVNKKVRSVLILFERVFFIQLCNTQYKQQ